MEDFEPMSPPNGLVDRMIKDSLSAAWAICPDVQMKDDIFICGKTGKRCFVFQEGKDCSIRGLT